MIHVAWSNNTYDHFIDPSTISAVGGSSYRGIETGLSQEATGIIDPSLFPCDLDVEIDYQRLSKTTSTAYYIAHPHSTSSAIVYPSPFPNVLMKSN